MAERDIVICDKHHGSLFVGLMYLFGKRLGYDVRFPFGMEWNERGYFDYSNKDFIVGTLTCPAEEGQDDPDTVYGYGAGSIGVPITVDEAIEKGDSIRYMVSTLHESEGPFARFIHDHAKDTILIRQCGNPNERVRYTRHALCADLETYNRIKGSHHAVLYHQEFNTEVFRFRKVSLKGWRKLRSFLNYLADMQYLRKYWERLVKEFEGDPVEFYMHGLKGADTPTEGWHGFPKDIKEQADWMADMHMLVQLKNWDGYGFIVHQCYAIGRPMIARWGDYEAKLGGMLLDDMKTGVKLTGIWEDDRKKIITILESDGCLAQMCWACRQRFEEVVDFNREEQEIRQWLSEM